MIICLVQWTSFNIRQQRAKVYTNEDIFFSKMFFNSWNWNVNKYEDADDTLSLIINQTSTAIFEDIIKTKIKDRTREQKFSLIIRRVIFISLNLFIISLGVASIFIVNLFNKDLQSVIPISSLATLLPALIVSFVNGFIPALTKKITTFEKYDFTNTLLKQQIWRNFAIRILNLSIYMILLYELAYNDPFLLSKPIIDFDSENYECRQDQALNNIVRLLLTEFFLKFITAIAWMSLNFCKGGCGLKKGWRAEFPVSDEVVWLLYFQAVIWAALLWSPFVSLVYPFMLYIMFKYIMLKLTWMQKKPLRSTNAQDLGSYIMIFLNISFLLVFIWIGLLLSEPHFNGTYKNGKQ